MSGRAFGFIISLIVGFFLLKACSDGAARVASVRTEEAHKAEIEAEYARTPYMIPPLSVRPIDTKAMARAEKIPESKYCLALGKALRGKDDEFIRAMIQRTADQQLGVLHLDHQEAIKKRQVILGMTPCMASASLGYPERVNRSVGSYGVHEQWVYDGLYVYFEDNVLTSFQD